MKVRVTHEISDNQRLGLGLALDGEFKMATRETCEAWLVDTSEVQLNVYTEVVNEMKADVIKKLNLS